VKRLMLVLLVLCPGWPALAQQNEAALLAGYTTSGGIEMKAPGITELEIAGSFTWGLAATHFFSPRLGGEVSWTRQDGALELETRDGSADLFDVEMSVLHGTVVYRFGSEDARLAPFVLAGMGATFLSAPDLEGETKFSWALGGGARWLASERMALRAQARYVHTRLGDSSSDFCDPFGFCQGSLGQFELTGGVVFRF
jgi:opacity protein-like surface antigen